MNDLWHSFLASSGVVALFIAAWSHLPLAADCSTVPKKVAFGALFGLGAIVCMAFAVQIQSGVILDLRNVMIAMAAFIGGPLAGLISGAIAAVYRLHLGGAGAVPAVVLMLAFVALGSLVHFNLRGRLPQRIDALLLAALVAALNVLSYVVFPDIRPDMETMAVGTGVRFVASLLAGLAMAKEVRRQAMARTNLIYGAVMEMLPDCLNVKDADGKFIVANPATANLMHATTAASLLGKSDRDFYPESVAKEFRELELQTIKTRLPQTIEQFVTHKNGATAWLSTLKVPVFDQGGHFQGLITHNRDISTRKRLEEELTTARERLQLTFSNMPAGVAMFDNSYRLLFCNEQYLNLFPMTRDVRKPGARFKDIIRTSLERGEKPVVSRAEIERQVEQAELPITTPTLTQFELSDGRWIEARINPSSGGYFVVYSDVTAQKNSEQELRSLNIQLEELAQVDALTGLLNRRAMDQSLKEDLARCARGLGATSLLLIDVDKFKAYNDTYGHLGGDECLRQVAQCLMKTVQRSTDRVARYGGEEFAAILSGTEEDDASRLAEQLRRNIQDLNILHAGSPHRVVTVSIGVATAPSGTLTQGTALTKLADEALYRAKGAGRNRVICAETNNRAEHLAPHQRG